MDEKNPLQSPPKAPEAPRKSRFARLAARVDSLGGRIIGVASISTWLKQHIGTSLYRNAYYLMAGAAVNSAFTFGFWAAATHYYPADDVGLATAAIAALGLLSSISDLGLGVGLVRFLPGAHDRGNSMVNTCFTLSSLASLVTAAVFLAGLGIWSKELLPIRQHPLFLAAFLSFAAIWTLDPQIDNVFVARRSTKFTLVKVTILSFLRLVLILVFAAIISGPIAIFAAAGLALLAVTLLNLLVLVPRVQPGYRPFPMVKRDIVGMMWQYVGANYIARTLSVASPLVLTLMVANVLGTKMNAYFSIPWQISSVMMMVPSSIFASLFAEGSNDEGSMRSNIRKSLKLMVMILIPIVLLILAIGDKLLLVFGRDYSEHGATFLRISVLTSFAYGMNYLYITIGRVKKETGKILAASAAMSALSLGLSGLLMSRMGLTGVALGWLAGQSIVALAVTIPILRQTRS